MENWKTLPELWQGPLTRSAQIVLDVNPDVGFSRVELNAWARHTEDFQNAEQAIKNGVSLSEAYATFASHHPGSILAGLALSNMESA